MDSAVYEIINTITNKRYIGSSVKVDQRQYAHFWMLSQDIHDNCLLQADYNEYGASAFDFHILEYVEEDELRTVEQRYLDATEDKYNIGKYAASGGYDLDNHPRSEEIRQKLREASTGRYYSPETRKKIGLANLGRKRSPETRKKMSDARKGRWTGEQSKRFIGYFITPSGKFASAKEAADACGISGASVLKVCKNPDTVIVVQAYLNSPYLRENHDKSVIGRTWRSLGFGFEPKA